MIRKDRREPIEAARESVSQPGGPDKAITAQLISHGVSRLIKKRKSCRSFPGLWRRSRIWRGKYKPLPWRPSSRLRSSYLAQPFSCRHNWRLEIWANGLARNDTSWHAQYGAVTRQVANNHRIRT